MIGFVSHFDPSSFLILFLALLFFVRSIPALCDALMAM